MLRDLDDAVSAPATLEADILIVGAGIAGLTIASRLSALGRRCLVLESGGRHPVDPDPIFSEVTFGESVYGGAIDGRARCLGGASVKWGGALIPFERRDLVAKPSLGHIGWPIEYDDLSRHIETVEEIFAVRHGTYDAPGSGPLRAAEGFAPREAKWPTFKRRNVAQLHRTEIEREGGVDVWLNATVSGFEVEGDRVVRLSAVNGHGRSVFVTANDVVIAAGAIESTRLLLLLDRATNGAAVLGRRHLGRYLQDHLSAPLATIETTNPTALNAIAAFRFDGATMRSLRFERATPGAAGGFVHIAPRPLGVSGFDALRDFFRSLQRGRLDLRSPFRMLLDMPYLARLAWWRLVRKRLLWPQPAVYEVHVVVEQSAQAGNRISLGEGRDAFGRPITKIDWRRGPVDLAIFKDFCENFDTYWTSSRLEDYGRLVWRRAPDALRVQDIEEAGDIYHPVGTTRISRTAEEGVVDANLAVHGLPNLFVAATSVFPNAGGSNPTMTLLLLAVRLAEKLARERAAG